jgi:glutaredoxin-related protein
MRVPDVELYWWEGCPSTETAVQELHEALSELGLDGVKVRMRQISSDQDAREAGFIGSPTVLVDGEDVAPAPGEPAGLTCRVYRRREGSISPTPDPVDVRDALRRAMAAETAR